MKALKRNFLVVEENIRLNEINYFQVSRYFNPSHFNLEDNLNLHFEMTWIEIPVYLKIIYFV